MVNIREEKASDAAAREALLDAAYGPARFAKTSERLREGREPARGLSLVAVDCGQIVGTVRLWHVTAGTAQPALLLGPLAVHPDHRCRGVGSALVCRAIARARLAGHGVILLIGDAAYYGRFGFTAGQTGGLRMPGRSRARSAVGAGVASRRAHGRVRIDWRDRRATAEARPERADRSQGCRSTCSCAEA